MSRLNTAHWLRLIPGRRSRPLTRAAYIRGDGKDHLDRLSRRHIQVLELFRDGLKAQDVAERLHISIHTVNGYSSEIYRRLEARNRPHAVIRAIELQLISLGSPPATSLDPPSPLPRPSRAPPDRDHGG